MAIPTFKGIITVVVTPFDQKGAVSFDTLRSAHRFSDFQWRASPFCRAESTGEYYGPDDRGSARKSSNLLQNKWRAECRFMRARTAPGPMTPSNSESSPVDLGYGAQMLAAPFYSLAEHG